MSDINDESLGETTNDFSRKRLIAALCTAFVCLTFYILTLARVPLAGESVANLLLLLDLAPVETFRNPLWFALGRGLLLLLPGSALVIVHSMNALMGAACAGLLFWMMAGIPHNRTSEEKIRKVRPLWPQFLSGFVAAAVLALCTPFWFASVRAYPHTLHVLLVLLLVLLLLIYRERGRFRWVFLFSVLYGLSLVEASVLILVSPLFLFGLLILLWQHKHLRVRWLALLLVGFLAGSSLVLLHAWSFMGTSTFVWREFRGYGHLLGVMLKDHYLLALRGVPRVGWLTIGLFSVLPWLLIVPFPKTASMKGKGFWSSYLLALLFTGFGMLVLANHAITPWAQFGLMPLVVLPYLFLASWMGYLAGYWYILAARPRRALSREAPARRRPLRRLYLCGVAVSLVLLATRSYRQVGDRHAGIAMRLARDVVASLDGREWLVTNGAIDGLILYAAYEAGIPLSLLNLGLSQAPMHRKHVASMLSDPRLRSLALVGIAPLLDEWIGRREGAVADVAVLTNADVWESKGFVAVPSGALLLGSTVETAPAADRLAEKAMPSFQRMVGGLDAGQEAVRPLPAIHQWVFAHYSKIANNLGVYLEDNGEAAKALDLYITALQINPENISALLNAYILTDGEDTEQARDIARRVKLFERDLDAGLPVWGLAHHHGYVRHPMAFLEMGWSWVMTGKPGAAIRDFERAAALSGKGDRFQMVLAALYFREGRDEESEQAYYKMLAQNPEDTTAIMGLARLAMRQGQYDQARGYLARLLELRVPPDIVEFELASLEILMGNLSVAVDKLEHLAERFPDQLRASAMLSLIAMDEGNEEALARHMQQLEQAKNVPPGIKLILAIGALREGAKERARAHLEEIVHIQPDHMQALEMLIKLDMGSGRINEAEDRIRQVFSLDPGHAFGNLALGSLQYVRGEFDLAETSFSTSIERQPTSEALNSLAWVYMSQGRYEEAQTYAAKAVRADAGNVFAWDTLGESSLYLGQLDLAERALLRASDLMPDSPRIIFHLAQLYEAKGDLDQAKSLADSLSRHGPQLPPDLYEDLLRFSARIN